MQIVEGVLRPGKAQVKQLASRIINENQKRAFGTAILKPPMVRAINLHQLAKALTAIARLMQTLLAFPA